jgi:predicted lipid carrier protein YhbT
MTVTLTEVFKKFEARLAKVDENDRKLKYVFKFIFTDATGKVLTTWVLDLVNVKIFVGDGTADVTLKMEEATMIGMVTGVMDATKAMNEDKIAVEGNYELVLALKPYLSSL